MIIETKDGESKIVNNTDIYEAQRIDTKYESRVDFGHGANVYCCIKGNSYIFDAWALTSVLENTFIDVRNVEYDFDITKEFTWDFRDLVEIKKRKRIIDRVLPPSLRVIKNIRSAQKFEKAR